MTLQEAKQLVDAYESQITLTYNNFKRAARDVGTAGYKAVSDEKAKICNDANGVTIMNTTLSLLISLLGLILCFALHPVWGILVIIAGLVVAYNVYQLAVVEAEKRINEANKILNGVNNQQTYLNSTLDQNNII